MLYSHKKTIIFFLFVFSMFGFTAHAQTPSQTEFFITPLHPGPNEQVTVRVENFAFDLNNLELVWSVDGKVEKRGMGERQFQFTTKQLGSVSTIKVSSNSFTKTAEIRPTGLELFWQANTYTPPFYKGKALYSTQSTVQFIAMPSFVGSDGKNIDPKTLSYKWSRNNSVLSNQSGYGKNFLSTSSGVLAKPFVIAVEVTNADGSLKSESAVELRGVQPQVLLYENHPLYGIMYNKALPSQFDLGDKEVSLASAPYFFGVDRKDAPALSYKWKMNGQITPNQEKPNSLVLRRPEGSVGGTAIISLAIENIEKMLQFANYSTTIKFEALNQNGGQINI